MAINNKYVSFKTVIERAFSRTGYQELDWNEAIEVIGETLRKIGALPAFREVVTNGMDGNPPPVEIIDYKGLLPHDLVHFNAARYVQVRLEEIICDADDEDADDAEEKPTKYRRRIVNFMPMTESLDLFVKSQVRRESNLTVSPGQYSWVDIENNNSPVRVKDVPFQQINASSLSYRLNDNFIFTTFENGFVEVAYTAFITDCDGFPMVPDDEAFIEAMVWSIIEAVDYKQWRRGLLNEKVYRDSEQNKLFYIASAGNKAKIPSLDKMESIKNMFVRSIKKVDFHDSSFSHANVGEKRYNHNWR